MSDKPSEYLKRTCLICGCHTNQTINIYEPRSGPNIVELIQAKFKFQPLNEDKYLCFSCNNWLINWHSLQALNSNDAESSSATFRPHMNSVAPEKGGAGSQQRTNACRPIAHVKPRQLESSAATATAEAAILHTPPTPPPVEASEYHKLQPFTDFSFNMPPPPTFRAKLKTLSYVKRSFKTTALLRCQRRPHLHKSLQKCCVCGRAIVIRRSRSGGTLAVVSCGRKTFTARCRKCREVCQWRAVHLSSLAKAERQQQQQQQPQPQQRQPRQQQNQSLVNITRNENFLQNQSKCLPRPRIDGKIVSMLRRLGTTLSREQATTEQSVMQQQQQEQQDEQQRTQQNATKLPTIMSPAKQKPRWTRQLDENEILLDFNTAISEVLPLIEERVEAQSIGTHGVRDEKERRQVARRTLTYEMAADRSSDEQQVCRSLCADGDDETEEPAEVVLPEVEVHLQCTSSNPQQWNPLESFYRGCLPQGLTVSLI